MTPLVRIMEKLSRKHLRIPLVVKNLSRKHLGISLVMIVKKLFRKHLGDNKPLLKQAGKSILLAKIHRQVQVTGVSK